jgi:hypothetical protein
VSPCVRKNFGVSEIIKKYKIKRSSNELTFTNKLESIINTGKSPYQKFKREGWWKFSDLKKDQ